MADQDLTKGCVGFGNNPALILVDMTVGFIHSDSPLGGQNDDVVNANKRLLSNARKAQVPIAFTSVVYKDQTSASIFRAHLPDLNILKHGSHWVEIDARLDKQDNEPVFEKTVPSGFFNTGLNQWLVDNHVDCIIVTGLTTSGCVRATVVDGLQYNYPVWVVADACADRNKHAHNANLHDMGAKYASVKTVNQVIDFLTQR